MKDFLKNYAHWVFENEELYMKILKLIMFVSFPLALWVAILFDAIVWAFFAPLVLGIVSELFLQYAVKKSGLLIMTEESHPELHKMMVEADAEYIAGQVEKFDVEKS